ncbi:sugar MFS transporter [Mangrovicoccus sp. HB161399]|uniref:MFS transporter n=1 Tax=Mangrovicoccus sp. HB161399 TaxID=2720392 RepID=UPI001551F8F1|nr:MFS transporter [Mangrovicoccus sp. HB161399]
MTVAEDFGAGTARNIRAGAAAPGYLLGRASLALAIFAALLASTTPSPLYPVYVAQWDLPQSAGTTIFSVYALGTLLALFLSGRINRASSDRRQVLLPALVATAAGAILFAMADGVPMLLAGRFLSGISTGLITSTASAAIYELSPPARRGHAAMISTVAFTGGAAAGPCLSSAALAADAAPLVTPFLCIAAVAALAFLGLLLSPWPKAKGTGASESGSGGTASLAERIGPVLGGRLFLLACLALTAAWILGSILMALGVTFATDLFHLQVHALAGLLPAIFQLFAGIGQVLGGQIRSIRAILAGFAAIAVLQVLVAGAATVPLPALFVLSMPLCGLAYGAAFVGGATLVNETSTAETLTGRISRFYVVGYLANAVPTFGMGFLIDGIGIQAAFLAFSAGLVALAACGIALALHFGGQLRRGG